MRRFLWWAFYEHPLIATFTAIVVFLVIAVAVVRMWPVRRRIREPIPFTVYREFEAKTKEALRSLSHWQRLVHALVVCRRFRPHYDNFTRISGFGDPAALDRVQALLLATLNGGEPSSNDIGACRKETEDAVPDTDALERIEYSPEHLLAQDAAIVHLSALGVLSRTGELDNGWWLASYCYNAADREAMDAALPLGGIVTAAVEAEVERSTPVQREVRWHEMLFGDLRSGEETSQMVEKLLADYAGEPLVGRRIESRG